MPYLRFTRDRRGYEHTYLLHDAVPGAPPTLLYYFRTAPGVRLGRPAFDEDAIRLIEERHPDLDFDWTHILEMGALAALESEAPADDSPRPRRGRKGEGERRGKSARGRQAPAPSAAPPDDAHRDDVDMSTARVVAGAEAESETREAPVPSASPASRSRLLEDLVGAGIASRLRARFEELQAQFAAAADPPGRQALADQLARLDPDGWTTAEQVLDGVQHADARSDALRRGLGLA